MSKTIILGGFSNHIEKYGVATSGLFKPIPQFLKPIRICCFKHSVCISYWLVDLKNIIKGYDTVILFDCPGLHEVCQEIEKSVPIDTKLILYYWNPIVFVGKRDLEQVSERWEKWSFDPDDAADYGLKYGGQFVFDKLLPTETPSIDSDLFFIGLNKGRFAFLRRMEKILKNTYGLTPNFIYVNQFKSLFSKKYSRSVEYGMMLSIASRSKSMVELNQNEQTGLTLRCLESLYLQKKLLTNNKNITNYSLFNPHNIYVINDELTGIDSFMADEYVPYSEDILSQYRFENWLKRLIDDVELTDYRYPYEK